MGKYQQSEMNKRLQVARENARFRSARAAAIRHHWNISTYGSHENGQTQKIPYDDAIEYAHKFKVSLSWLLTGVGKMKSSSKELYGELFDALPAEQHPQAIDFLRFLKDQGK